MKLFIFGVICFLTGCAGINKSSGTYIDDPLLNELISKEAVIQIKQVLPAGRSTLFLDSKNILGSKLIDELRNNGFAIQEDETVASDVIKIRYILDSFNYDNSEYYRLLIELQNDGRVFTRAYSFSNGELQPSGSWSVKNVK